MSSGHPRQTILLISHMRSYSSLIGHLLGSHREVVGYFEHRLSYESAADVRRLHERMAEEERVRRCHRFVFDKVLHDQFLISDCVLSSADVVPILSIREPHRTLRSLLVMWDREGNEAGVAVAAEYLSRRYETLASLSERNPHASVVFGEALVRETKATLRALQRLLGLRRPLREDYARFRRTGIAGFGDPSDAIKAGKVLTDRAAPEFVVSPEIDRELWSSYQNASTRMRNAANSVIGAPVQRRSSVSEPVSSI